MSKGLPRLHHHQLEHDHSESDVLMNDTTASIDTLSAVNTAPTTSGQRELVSTMAYLARVLKTPTIGRCWEELAIQARDQGWSHEDYLATVLQRQVADREANGTALRIAGAHFPQIKTLEDFNTDHQPSLRRDILAHLATTTWVVKADNVVLLGPPGVGKTHLAIGLCIKAIQAGHSVVFDTATNWISRLTAAHAAGRLEKELTRLRRYKLLIIDEVGYIPFDHDAANLFFQLVAARYEQGAILVPRTYRSGGGARSSPTTSSRPQ